MGGYGVLGRGGGGGIKWVMVWVMFVDSSINMGMEGLKMMVGEMVKEKEKGVGYWMESLLWNGGRVVGYVLGLIFGWVGMRNRGGEGVIGDWVM